MPSGDTRSRQVEETLAGPAIHREWVDHYYSRRSEALRERMFDDILQELAAPAGSIFLDVGCGNGAHSVRLARRGYQVRAVDSSESALRMARDNVRQRGLESAVALEREDILSLSFADGSFDYAVCWGVLMHVPELERAVGELARVLRAGGRLVISEANMSSIQSRIMRHARGLFRRGTVRTASTVRGVEYWISTAAGPLLTREASIPYLVETCSRTGLNLGRRWAGDLFDLHVLLPWEPLRDLLHLLNRMCYRRIGRPSLAFGNILIFEKRS